jgi:hypothetical protein
MHPAEHEQIDKYRASKPELSIVDGQGLAVGDHEYAQPVTDPGACQAGLLDLAAADSPGAFGRFEVVGGLVPTA